jgi:hypothetical protein
VVTVTITFSTAAGWSVPEKCAWACDSGYALTNGQCLFVPPVLTLTLASSGATLPGVPLTYTATVQNTSSAVAADGQITISLPDSTSQTFSTGRIDPGSSVSKTMQWQVPTIDPIGSGETFVAYMQRLGASDGKEFSSQATTTWTDAPGNSYGPATAFVTTVQALPIVATTAGGAPMLLPGQTADAPIMLSDIGLGPAKIVTLGVYRKDDGSLVSSTQSSLASQERKTVTVQVGAPAITGKVGGESDES